MAYGPDIISPVAYIVDSKTGKDKFLYISEPGVSLYRFYKEDIDGGIHYNKRLNKVLVFAALNDLTYEAGSDVTYFIFDVDFDSDEAPTYRSCTNLFDFVYFYGYYREGLALPTSASSNDTMIASFRYYRDNSGMSRNHISITVSLWDTNDDEIISFNTPIDINSYGNAYGGGPSCPVISSAITEDNILYAVVDNNVYIGGAGSVYTEVEEKTFIYQYDLTNTTFGETAIATISRPSHSKIFDGQNTMAQISMDGNVIVFMRRTIFDMGYYKTDINGIAQGMDGFMVYDRRTNELVEVVNEYDFNPVDPLWTASNIHYRNGILYIRFDNSIYGGMKVELGVDVEMYSEPVSSSPERNEQLSVGPIEVFDYMCYTHEGSSSGKPILCSESSSGLGIPDNCCVLSSRLYKINLKCFFDENGIIYPSGLFG